jgi:PQQ-dependent dehydrogenase (methanol/ethanol family)
MSPRICTRSTSLIALALLGACGRDSDRDKPGAQLTAPAQRAETPGAIPGIKLVSPVPNGQWTLPLGDLAATRFSPLAQLDKTNVGKLHIVSQHSTGIPNGHEGGPLVVGTTMYVVTPFPNDLLAFDLTKEGHPLKWRYQPHPDGRAVGIACCDVVNRGASYANGKIIYNLLDGHTVAVDAETGEEKWRATVGNINIGETFTMAPLVVKNHVIVGNSGGELGVRGKILALDVDTGSLQWQAYNTGPDEEVKIGASFKPFYPKDRGGNLGVSTFPPGQYKLGGSTVWGWVSYDPELDLLFHGTANPGPWNHEMRPGDNKWTCGVFARRPDTGEAIWFYQWTPHDVFDHDGINESIVVDLDQPGGKRQVLLHAERNGYVYVLDRATGQVLSADPFVHITSSRGVDLKTGKLVPEPSKEPRMGRTVRDICPAAPGAKEWSPSAYSPRTGLLYIPHLNLCMDFEPMDVSYIEGTPFVGAEVTMYGGPGGHRGGFTAWDPVARKAVWHIDEDFPVISSALVTGGGLVFYGTMDGVFKAVDARTGEERWRFDVPSGIVGQPISFLGPDGKQYVAVASGVGGWAGAVVSGKLDPRDPTAALGFANAMRDLPKRTARGGTLYVFGL